MDNENDSTIDYFIVDFCTTKDIKVLPDVVFDDLFASKVTIITRNFSADIEIGRVYEDPYIVIKISRSCKEATISHERAIYQEEAYFNTISDIFYWAIGFRRKNGGVFLKRQ